MSMKHERQGAWPPAFHVLNRVEPWPVLIRGLEAELRSHADGPRPLVRAVHAEARIGTDVVYTLALVFTLTYLTTVLNLSRTLALTSIMIGTVFNPVVGGPDRLVNLESSVNTHYDALLVSAETRTARYGLRAAYTFAKAFNYANDDQIPFSNGPIDPNDLRRESGPTPNDQRHRFTTAAWISAPGGFMISPLWTMASDVPMDILMPDGTNVTLEDQLEIRP